MPALTLTSRSNERSHWSVRHRRDVAEAAAVRGAWAGAGLAVWKPPLPVCVTLLRVYGGRGKAMDTDNLGGAMKAVRDAVAVLIGVDDADDRVRWRVRQHAARAGESAGVAARMAGR